LRTRKIFAKKFGKKFGNLSWKKVQILTKIVRKFQKNYICKVSVFESKNPVFGSKSLEKVWKKFGKSSKSSETGFSKHLEISEIVLFQTFQKLRKNDVKLKLRKSQKTRSDSKVRLKVRNAGP